MGNQRRLALALAIAHRPDLLLLDEPTAGLDVASRTELHAIMRELADGGTAVLLATHDMAEAEKMTDRIAILLGGRIVAQGTALEITASGSGVTKVTVSTERGTLLAAARRCPRPSWRRRGTATSSTEARTRPQRSWRSCRPWRRRVTSSST